MKISEYKVKVQWQKEEIPYSHLLTLSSKGLPEITATTLEDQGSSTGFWSPEHLFVASASICLSTTFLSIAERSNLKIENFHVESTGIIDIAENKGENKNTMAEIQEKFYLFLSDLRFEKKARKILEKSVENCIITNSIKSIVSIDLILE